jgi:hypothetical protein
MTRIEELLLERKVARWRAIKSVSLALLRAKDREQPREPPGSPEGGRFASSGDGAESEKPAKESTHPTQPLPDTPDGGYAVYDLPSEEGEEQQTLKIERRPDGSYYGSGESFDVEKPNAAAMRAQLAKWKATYAGWESKKE